MKTYVISGVTVLAIIATSITYMTSNSIFASPSYVETRINQTKEEIAKKYPTKEELRKTDEKVSLTYEMVKALYIKLIPDTER